MGHMMLEYSETSPDGLRARRWRFFVSPDRGDIQATLDSYAEASRASVRHKFRQEGRFYERTGRATHGSDKLSSEQVPWPPYLTDKISEMLTERIVVGHSRGFGQPLEPAVPNEERDAWEAGEVEMAASPR